MDFPSLLIILQTVSMLSFFIYGIGCFVSLSLKSEFARYGFASLRPLIGFLEIAGATGLAVGYFSDPVRILSAACLALLMFFAVGVRLRIRDPLLACLPAIVLLFVNLYIAMAPW